MPEPETKPQAASEPTAATPETHPDIQWLHQLVGTLLRSYSVTERYLDNLGKATDRHSEILEALCRHHTTTTSELKRLDAFDKRLRHTEELCIPRPGETDLSIADAYQAMVHEIAALKVAVIDLQKRQKQLEGDPSDDRPVTIDPIYNSPSKH